MSPSDTAKTEIDAQAAAWLARVYASDVSDADLAGLTTWLEASEDHGRAFDRAEALWLAADDLRADPVTAVPAATPQAELTPAPVIDLSSRRASRPRQPDRRAWMVLGALAATVTGLAVLPLIISRTTAPVTYATAKGEHSTIALKDGTQLYLDSDTRLTVRMTGKTRQVDLQQGEVALAVVHNPNRPFMVTAGDSTLSDIGTEFNVLRVGNRVTVTVRSGTVGVKSRKDDSDGPILQAGDQAVIDEASGDVVQRKVDAAASYGWQQGQVVYQDEPLSYVVSDLNRYFTVPLVVDEATGKMRLNAVIHVDSEASVVKRLQAFLPLEATATDTAVILRRKP